MPFRAIGLALATRTVVSARPGWCVIARACGKRLCRILMLHFEGNTTVAEGDKPTWSNPPADLDDDARAAWQRDATMQEGDRRRARAQAKADAVVAASLGRYDGQPDDDGIDDDDHSNFNGDGLRIAPRIGPRKPLPMPPTKFRYLSGTISPDEREAFLQALSLCGDWNHASHSVGRSGTALRELAKTDPMFSLDVQQCAQNYRELLHQELVRRIFVGDDEPVVGKDGILGYVTKRSDRLLEFELKHRWPQLYSENYKAAEDSTGQSGVLVVPEQLERGTWSHVAANSLAKNTSADAKPQPKLTKPVD